MGSRSFSGASSLALAALALLAAGLVAGCAGGGMQASASSTRQEAHRPERVEPSSDSEITGRRGPRVVASLELTSKAAGLLDRGRPDEAIRVLERALGLNPESARAYYQMARAWKQKGDFSQALEYNRMAAMYPAGDREWAEKIRGQRRRILERKGAD